jgi:hypothetical protein
MAPGKRNLVPLCARPGVGLEILGIEELVLVPRHGIKLPIGVPGAQAGDTYVW